MSKDKSPGEKLLDAVTGDPSIGMPPLHSDPTFRMINRDEQLRELLSYCQQNAETPTYADPYNAYQDVVDKLREILDGEQ